MGWSDVVQNVVQRYSVEDAGATSTLTEMATSAVGLASTLASVEYMYGRFMGMVGRGQSMLMGAVRLGSQRQELELTIAGTLRAYNVAGERMDSINRRFAQGTQGWRDATIEAFNAAQSRSSGVLAQITRDADALPGEAEDYLQTFQTAMPAALSTTRRSLEEITALSNMFTATALVNQIDAPQAGRDLMLMLQGSAGMDVRTWRTLQALVKNPGTDTQANMTPAQQAAAQARDPTGAHRWRGGNQRQMQATQFNRLTGEQRFEAIRRALEIYKPLLDRMSHTWSTQIGTFEAGITRLKRMMAMPIFDAALNFLEKVNQKLSPIMTQIATIGSVFTNYIAQGMEWITSKIDGVWKKVTDMAIEVWNSPMLARIVNTLQVVGHTLAPLLGTSNGQMGIIAALFGTGGAVIANLIRDPRMMTAISGFTHTIEYIVDRLQPWINLAGNFNTAFSDLIMKGILVAVQAFDVLVHGIVDTWNLMRGFATLAWIILSPVFYTFREILGAIFNPSRMLITALEGLVFMVKLAVVTVGTVLVTALLGVAIAVTFVLGPIYILGRAIVSVVNYIRSFMPASVQATMSGVTEGLRETFSRPQFMNDIQAALLGLQKTNKNAPDNARDRQPTPHVGQDFRYSRFDIRQAFSEGFSPDRVASAFAEDLAGLAENRLQSGFQPGFTSFSG